MSASSAGSIVHVRRAVPGDAEAIGRVHVRAWQESYAGLLPEAEIARWTAAGRSQMWRTALIRGTARGICVAEIDGVVVGFGACADQRAPELKARGFTGEVTAIYVLRAAQRRGAGRQLMAAMEHAAKEHGCTAAYLTTFSFQARPFYESLGYEVFGTLDDYPPGYQKFFMKKALT